MSTAAEKRYAQAEFITETERQEAYFASVRTMFEVRAHILAGNVPQQSEALAEMRAACMVVATAHSAYMRAVAATDRLIAEEQGNANG
ncbi:MAG: hypothetical protein ACREHG_04925 [Candidatus Saccharimonadales bacterium]